jgi:iron-sulfur cluster assembly accessory protein
VTEVKTAPVQNMLSLTPSAAEQVRVMQESQPENMGKPLRVYVEGGGCSGMQYGMVFDEPRDKDVALEFHGVRVVVDEVSADYLKGALIDFSDALTGGGFKITNPNAKSSCGCGKSFEA